MGDDNQGLCPPERAIKTSFERFRIERRKAFVENRELSALQQGACEKNAASFTMGQLPTGFSDGLHHAGRHSPQQIFKTQLNAKLLRFL